MSFCFWSEDTDVILRGAFSIWWRDMLVLRRSIFSELLAVVAYPLTLYLAFGVGLKGYIAPVGGVPYPVFIAPGLISMTAVIAAFDESAWSMWFHRRVQRTIEEYRVTPITVFDIVIGKILCGLSHGTIKGVVVTMVICLFTPFRFSFFHLLAYLNFIVLGSMIFSCLGTIVGTTVNKPENIGRIQAVIVVPLIFMSGIFFPLTSYPSKILPFIRLLPTTAAFEGARQALLNGAFETGYALNLAITAPLIFILAVYTFNKWMEE